MRSSSKQRACTGHIAEFPVALFVLFFLFIFPIVNLLGLATASATTCLLAHIAVSRAAAQEKYNLALQAMTDEADNFLGTGLAAFARLKPEGGYGGSGCNLYVTATNYRGQQVVTHGPNRPIPPPVDTSQWIYEYRCDYSGSVSPVINLSFVPLVKDIPGLGMPARLVSSAHRVAEYPTGLSGKTNASSLSSGGNKSFQSRVPGSGAAADQVQQVAESGWDFPNLYAQIAQAGQEVVESTVLKVPAASSTLTDTTLTVTPGQRLWFDFKSEGQWVYSSSQGFTAGYTVRNNFADANGSEYIVEATDDCPLVGAPLGSLIGRVGTGESFFVGRDKRNYEPQSNGKLGLMINDGWFQDNWGELTVRIVVTQVKN